MEIVQEGMRGSRIEKERNLDHFLFQYEQNVEVWRNMQRIGVQFWDPAGPEDVQRAVPSMLVEVLQARVADMQQKLRCLELKWQQECQPVVGLDFDCLQGEMSQFKAWMEQQLR